MRHTRIGTQGCEHEADRRDTDATASAPTWEETREEASSTAGFMRVAANPYPGHTLGQRRPSLTRLCDSPCLCEQRTPHWQHQSSVPLGAAAAMAAVGSGVGGSPRFVHHTLTAALAAPGRTPERFTQKGGGPCIPPTHPSPKHTRRPAAPPARQGGSAPRLRRHAYASACANASRRLRCGAPRWRLAPQGKGCVDAPPLSASACRRPSQRVVVSQRACQILIFLSSAPE